MRTCLVLLMIACSSRAPTTTTSAPRPAAQRAELTTSTGIPTSSAHSGQTIAPAVEPVPTACPPDEKRFRCHELAVVVHLGIGRPAEPAAAKTLYADACQKGYSPSCNNLAVLATMHSELALDVDPATLWETACKKFDQAACDNARRLKQRRALAVKLTLGDVSTEPSRMKQLKAAACSIGDVFQCDDAASRQQVGALLAAECRGGQHEQCFDAANGASDAAALLELMTISCNHRDGKACHALAKRKLAEGAEPRSLIAYWKSACSDNDFDVGAEDVAARNEDCDRWSKAAKSPRDLLAIAALTQPRCENDDRGACAIATSVLDRAGASTRAFALVKRVCEASADTQVCLDLSGRYALGRGAAHSVPKSIELSGPGCAPPRAWEVCKAVADYELKHPELGHAAGEIYKAFCDANHNEACYLGARAAEASKSWCHRRPWDDVQALRETYAALCKARFKDACKREATMCTLAQREFLRPRGGCFGSATGDGTFRPGPEYETLIALCPKETWSKDVQRKMTKVEEYRAYLEGAPR